MELYALLTIDQFGVKYITTLAHTAKAIERATERLLKQYKKDGYTIEEIPQIDVMDVIDPQLYKAYYLTPKKTTSKTYTAAYLLELRRVQAEEPQPGDAEE